MAINATVHDVLLNTKESDTDVEKIMLPYTRAENIIGGFDIIGNKETSKLNSAGPYFFLKTDEVELSEAQLILMTKLKKNQ